MYARSPIQRRFGSERSEWRIDRNQTTNPGPDQAPGITEYRHRLYRLKSGSFRMRDRFAHRNQIRCDIAGISIYGIGSQLQNMVLYLHARNLRMPNRYHDAPAPYS